MRTSGVARPEPGRAGLHAVLRLLVLLLAGVVCTALLAGCAVPTRVEHPRLPPGLPPEVDSLVIPPFERAPDVELAPVELALLPRYLGEALARRAHLRVHEQPPTRLPNTVRLAGRLEALAVNERSGDGLQLRTVDLTVEVQVLPIEGEAPLLIVRRRTARQRVYVDQPMSALALDLEDAVREVTAQLAQALAPLPDPAPIALRAGDPERPHPALRAGNAAAAAGDFRQAWLHWQAVLFDPAPANAEGRYRVSPAVLNHLRATDVPEAVVQRLAPLTARGAEDLVTFRQSLRTALGGDPEFEGRILTFADSRFALAHANLAAAHANLAALAALERRGDLAAYHWGRAWGHDPDPALLESWRAEQDARKTLPRGISAEAALRAYLRIPAPATAAVQPGTFERTVLPPPAFEVAVSESAPARQSGQPAPQTESQPTALPPPEPTAGDVTNGAGTGTMEPTGERIPEPAAAPATEGGTPGQDPTAAAPQAPAADAGTSGRAAGSSPAGDASAPANQ